MKATEPSQNQTKFKNKNWLLLLLLWQIIGFVVTLIVAIPKGNFHYFIDDLILCLSLTNGVALLCSLYFQIHQKWLKYALTNSYLRIIISILVVGLIIATATKSSFYLVSNICGIDQYTVSRWHLLTVTVNLIVLTVITAAVVLYFLYQRLSNTLAVKIQENEKLQRLQVESKLSLLQSKVNPHFLFNTLNTMLDIVKRNPGEVEKMILNLSDIYRKTLTMPDNTLVPLKEELLLVRQYLEIEKVRMGKRLNYEIKAEQQLDSYKIPPMIVQIIVENSIKHGLSPKKEGGSIKILTKKKNGRVQIDVTDSGVGIDLNKAHSGFGIYSIQQRLKLNYGESAKFNISKPESGGTYIGIELPHDN